MPGQALINRLTIGLIALCLLYPLAAGAAPASGPQIELKTWTLANGLRVVFSPHRRVPAVTVQVWYHAGSKDERPGIRGVAHMFEHMMFKGSRHVRPEAHARMISAIGGSINAFTTQDVTAYHNTLPQQYFEFAMKLEAERMRNLVLTDKTIKSEREVVKEEKRVRLENSPIGRALEALHALAYRKHPYSWTPAGDIPDLNRIKREDCQAFYDRYYVPNNATLIVVGDVDEKRVRAATNKYFGKIPRKDAPPRLSTVEPPQTKMRQKIADWPSQLAVVVGSYHIPAARHPDMAALDVLSAILSAGRSSRMHQSLVRKGKLAVQAGGFIWPHEHPGMMMIYGVGLPNHDVNKIKARLLAEVALVANKGVTQKELKKAKNQLVTANLSRMKTIRGIAHRIGDSTYVRGNPRAFLKDVAKLDQVTAADVKRVTATYLKPTNLTLVILPPGSGKKPNRGRKPTANEPTARKAGGAR